MVSEVALLSEEWHLKFLHSNSSGSLKDIWAKTKGGGGLGVGWGGGNGCVTLLTFRQLPQVEVQKFAESVNRSI